MFGDLPLFLKMFEEVVGVQRILIKAKPPTCVTKDDAINACLEAQLLVATLNGHNMVPPTNEIMRAINAHACTHCGRLMAVRSLYGGMTDL